MCKLIHKAAFLFLLPLLFGCEPVFGPRPLTISSSSREFTVTPLKTVYAVGEAIDPARDLEVFSRESDGSWLQLTPEAFRIDPSAFTVEGTQTVIVTGTAGKADPFTYTVTVTGTSSIEMVLIIGGTFPMGQEGVATPVHSVTVSSFNMGKYEVTQAQYEAVMGTNPASGRGVGDSYPVYNVSWYDAIAFCNKLSMREGLTPAYTISGSTDPAGWGTVPTSDDSTWNGVTVNWNASGYRLPTEAEWEYACRAGTTTAYNTGDAITDSTGWYSGNSGNTTHAVGQKLENVFGLYDMHGNVFEWCWDRYEIYDNAAQTDPHGPSAGSSRILRGGSWLSGDKHLRSASRGPSAPASREGIFGFRLARPCS
ncbi:MAG: formylglycine-generating enzyme family protein [Treponema sp.]|jgi:formylglycine-generating enzyme required for sulfatase activity|nr:formylglycine-generating enzyme family protein [Treponema sp.]